MSLNGPVNATFDDSPSDGSHGVLFGFVGGDEARAHVAKTRADRRAAVLRNFVDDFGGEAAYPREYFETDWPNAKVVSRRPGGDLRPRHPDRARRRSASRPGSSTGWAPRHRTTGTATWTAPSAPACGRPARCSTSCEARPRDRGGGRRRAARPRAGGLRAGAPALEQRLLARVPPPGFPALAYVHPNGRIYVGT